MSAFCVLEYLYRDAANWKTHGEALLTGVWSPGLVAKIEAALDGDRLFVAEQVGLPALQVAHGATYGGDPALDHAFHEFVNLRPATLEDLSGSEPVCSVEAVVEAFGTVGGNWRCSLSEFG